MSFKYPLAALVVTASLFGCATSSTPETTVTLQATPRNAGQIANTTLVSRDNKTDFNFFIGGIPDGTTLPLRLYTFVHNGSCQQLGTVAYAMNDQVNTQRNGGTNTWNYYRTAPVEMKELLSGKYAIVVRTAPENGNVNIFCGDIKAPAH